MSTPDTATPSLYHKLAEVAGAVGRVPKNGRNEFHKYDYVTESDLVEAVRSLLSERNVALIPSVEGVEKDGTLTTVRMAFTFADGDSGDVFRATWAGAGDDKGDKGLYKAYTGALKYFLMKTFLIATGDDPEADTGSERAGQANGKAAPTLPAGTVDEFLALAQQAVNSGRWDGPTLSKHLVAAGARDTSSVRAAVTTLSLEGAEEFRRSVLAALDEPSA